MVRVLPSQTFPVTIATVLGCVSVISLEASSHAWCSGYTGWTRVRSRASPDHDLRSNVGRASWCGASAGLGFSATLLSDVTRPGKSVATVASR